MSQDAVHPAIERLVELAPRIRTKAQFRLRVNGSVVTGFAMPPDGAEKTFAADMSKSPPAWTSNDDAFWQPLRTVLFARDERDLPSYLSARLMTPERKAPAPEKIEPKIPVVEAPEPAPKAAELPKAPEPEASAVKPRPTKTRAKKTKARSPKAPKVAAPPEPAPAPARPAVAPPPGPAAATEPPPAPQPPPAAPQVPPVMPQWSAPPPPAYVVMRDDRAGELWFWRGSAFLLMCGAIAFAAYQAWPHLTAPPDDPLPQAPTAKAPEPESAPVAKPEPESPAPEVAHAPQAASQGATAPELPVVEVPAQPPIKAAEPPARKSRETVAVAPQAKQEARGQFREPSAGCYKQGETVTVWGRASRTGDAWILSTISPLCVYEQASAPRMITELQVIGQPPPQGEPLALTGELYTRADPRYAMNHRIRVKEGRRLR